MMGDGQAETCSYCGAAFLSGCVQGDPCPDCAWKIAYLTRSGWKLVQNGMGARFGLGEELWEDPRFGGTKLTRAEAIKLQEGRDVEAAGGS